MESNNIHLSNIGNEYYQSRPWHGIFGETWGWYKDLWGDLRFQRINICPRCDYAWPYWNDIWGIYNLGKWKTMCDECEREIKWAP